MRLFKYSFFFLALFFITLCSAQSDQEIVTDGWVFAPVPNGNCLTKSQREHIKRDIASNIQRLEEQGRLPIAQRSGAHNFGWPVRIVDGTNYNNFYSISGHVDHFPGPSILRDYHCGSKTYDGHRGTDIFTWPFAWYLFLNDMAYVVAAEGGIIVDKRTGNLDQNCEFGRGDWNAVYIRHTDGSVAWYGHLKRGSLTSKDVGDVVEPGEYLGVIGSSGNSTGPHLHLEVYDSHNNLIDPFNDECNDLNNSSWWSHQPRYDVPTLNAIFTHQRNPEFGCPAINEANNFANKFKSGQEIIGSVFYRDISFDDITTFTLKNAQNTVLTWSMLSTFSEVAAGYWWSRMLPDDGPFGNWSYEVDYKGQKLSHDFEYRPRIASKIVEFRAQYAPVSAAEVNWTVAYEWDNKGFEVEHLQQDSSWLSLGFIASRGNTNSSVSYTFDHLNPRKGFNTYRLKQIDLEDNIRYSDISEVFINASGDFDVIPNPISDGVVKIVGLLQDGDYANLYDIHGRLILSDMLDVPEIDISYLLPGMYILVVEGDDTFFNKRILTY